MSTATPEPLPDPTGPRRRKGGVRVGGPGPRPRSTRRDAEPPRALVVWVCTRPPSTRARGERVPAHGLGSGTRSSSAFEVGDGVGGARRGGSAARRERHEVPGATDVDQRVPCRCWTARSPRSWRVTATSSSVSTTRTNRPDCVQRRTVVAMNPQAVAGALGPQSGNDEAFRTGEVCMLKAADLAFVATRSACSTPTRRGRFGGRLDPPFRAGRSASPLR